MIIHDCRFQLRHRPWTVIPASTTTRQTCCCPTRPSCSIFRKRRGSTSTGLSLLQLMLVLSLGQIRVSVLANSLSFGHRRAQWITRAHQSHSQAFSLGANISWLFPGLNPTKMSRNWALIKQRPPQLESRLGFWCQSAWSKFLSLTTVSFKTHFTSNIISLVISFMENPTAVNGEQYSLSLSILFLPLFLTFLLGFCRVTWRLRFHFWA